MSLDVLDGRAVNPDRLNAESARETRVNLKDIMTAFQIGWRGLMINSTIKFGPV